MVTSHVAPSAPPCPPPPLAARRQRDFGAADAIRERLRASGVTLVDKEKLWTTLDGRRGSFATETPTVLQPEGGHDAANVGSEPAAIVSVAVHSPPQTQSADAQSLTLSESVNVNPRYRGE